MDLKVKEVNLPVSLTAWADGDGLWKAPKGLPVKLTNAKAIIYHDVAEGDVWGHLQFETDVPQEDFLFYTDSGIEAFVNDKMKGRYGVSDVCWSEQGMQDTYLLDFDMDGELAIKLLESINESK